MKVLDDDLGVGDSLRYGPGAEVDAVWHSHLLRPSHYAAVCTALTGSRKALLEHDPATAARSDVAQRVACTARRMQALFGRQRKCQHSSSGMQIIIKTLYGTSEALDVRLSDTIMSVKRNVEANIGLPFGELRLIFCGKQLEDNRTLEDYSVKNQAIIHLDLVEGRRGC